MRQEFIRMNDTHESQVKYAQSAFFLAYWPLTYVISRQVRPVGVFLWTAAYYGIYRAGALGFLNSTLQGNLNKSAEPFAVKYGVRKPDEYAN